MITTAQPVSGRPAASDPRELLREAIDREGSAAAVARRMGLSTAYIQDVRHGRRPAGDRLLAGLGLERRIVPVEGGR
ncbi:hypothetical protein [Methylobacterium sp.]|uniref:hypothetical protein n=1 Tax=Methylobacterium sp. TaxID=409 RepID=UPI000FBE224E|nr:hypothetical protein [Methylobacterium sp.]RUP21449.1 MAG: hypothetical protein EKK44_09390 [Methylobacterium sp.]